MYLVVLSTAVLIEACAQSEPPGTEFKLNQAIVYSILALQGLEIVTYMAVLILLLIVLAMFFEVQYKEIRLPLIGFMGSMVISLAAREIVYIVIYVQNKHRISKEVNNIQVD